MFTLDQSLLLVIDVQGKLASLMQHRNKLNSNLRVLLKAAQFLDIPFFHTEQAPEKIGSTIDQIADLFPYSNPIAKKTFSGWGSEEFRNKLREVDRKQVIVSGIEAHVCVYQTVADLLQQNYEVQVIADAVSSRTDENLVIGLERMKSLGAGISSTEMIVTELIGSADHPKFKEVLELIK